MQRCVAVGLLVLSLFACSGDSPPPDIEDLAQRMGCEELELGSVAGQPKAAKRCNIGGGEKLGVGVGDVLLLTFDDKQAQDAWLRDWEQGQIGQPVVGEMWIANTTGADVAETVRDRIGGEII